MWTDSPSLLSRAQEPSETPFDMESVPKEVRAVPSKERAGGKRAGKDSALGGPPKPSANPGEVYEKLLGSIPEFSGFGKLFKVRKRAGFWSRSFKH